MLTRVLEQGTVKIDAGRGAQRLRQTMEAVRKAEAAMEKLRRSISRQQVRQAEGGWHSSSEARLQQQPPAGRQCSSAAVPSRCG